MLHKSRLYFSLNFLPFGNCFSHRLRYNVGNREKEDFVLASNHSMDLTTGSVPKKLIVFAMPVLLSNLLQQLYNAADVIVVGRFATDGETALAAVGSTGAITLLLLNIFIGLSIGANIVCSNLYGARKKQSLSNAMHASILLALLCGVGIGVIGVVFARPLLKLMSVKDPILDSATVYMQIFFCGAPFSLLYNFGSAIMRAFGDTRRPMYILAATGVINVGVNLLLVIVFRMDVAGVALATIISQFVSAVIVLAILLSPRGEYKLQLRKLRFHREAVGKIVSLGVPCGMNGIVFSVSNVLIQSTINTFSPAVIAGNTTGSNITDFVYLIINSLCTANVSFAGQCYGAKKYHRIDKLLVSSMVISTVGTLLMALGLTFFSTPVISLYSTEPDIMAAALTKVLILSWPYFLCGIGEMFIGCLRGIGQSTVPTVLNLGCICVPRIIWVTVFFPMIPQPWFLYLCFPISWAISAVAQGIFYRHCRRQLTEREALTNEPAQ